MQQLHHLSQQVSDGCGFGAALVQQRQRLLCRACQVFGICQPVAFQAQFVFFASMQAGRFNFFGLIGQHFHSPRHISLLRLETHQLALNGPHGLVGLPVDRQGFTRLGKAIQQSHVRPDIEQ